MGSMSYLVLARKYRSRNFSELVGQEHVVQALGNALQTGRLHHAYLFTGTRGVGKTTVSRILAKALNCLGPDGQGGITAEPCGVCDACRDIDAGRFVDYTELDAASNRGVDEVQSLLEQAVYKPVQGRFKVFMIDEVHMLTGHAFNAMLKTLEEPPEYLKFVLATTDPQKVPVTVLSRCLQFNLRPMAPDTVHKHLAAVLGTEGITAEAGALRLIARAARGSMRDALSLTDQAIAFGNGEVGEEAVRQMLGGVDRSHVLRLIDALGRSEGRAVVETVDTLRTHGISAAATLEDMSAVLQRMAVAQAVPGMAPSADIDDAEAAETARLAAAMPADETQLLYSLCLHGRGELGLAPDEYAALTMVLLRLLAFKPAGAVTAGAAVAEKKTLKTAEASAVPVAAAATDGVGTPKPEQASAVSGAAPALQREAPPTTAVKKTPTPTPTSTPALASAPAPAPAPAAASLPRPSAPVADTRPVPPWEEMPAEGNTPVTGENSDRNMPQALSQQAQAATTLIAVPVREQSERDTRLQPRSNRSGGSGGMELPASALGADLPGFEATPHGEHWHATVSALSAAEAIGALVRELALQSQLMSRDDRHWTLRVERESLNQAATRERLRLALSNAGHADLLTVELGIVIDSPARRNAWAAQQRQRQAEAILRDDPFVQQMVREFGAKIVPGTLRATPLKNDRAADPPSTGISEDRAA